MSISRQVPIVNWEKSGRNTRDDEIAAEVPVALTYNKRSHVVMMVTPSSLEDFAVGFSLSEGIISRPSDILDISRIVREKGLELAIRVNEECFARLAKQRRNLVGRTGCGLCGAESLDQAMRSPAVVTSHVSVTPEAIQVAIRSLNQHQPLQARTGAVHGAAWCSTGGEFTALREDVGRHIALDKLIGHLRRMEFRPENGFLVISSRASYEMVLKAAATGMEVLVAVSAPTTLAVEFALESGLTLIGFARPGRHNIYTGPERLNKISLN